MRLLEKWNRVHNLTAVRDARDMIGRHVLDSLALLPWLVSPSDDGAHGRADDGIDGSAGTGAERGADTSAGVDAGVSGEVSAETSGRGGTRAATVDLLDIGSGGGIPVLPLAIARPDLRCLSVDAVGKKIRFQRQAVLELGLARVDARHARIEDVSARARVVVSRAFAAPADFLVAAAPRCAAGGTALVMLGRRERLPDALPEPFALGEIRALDVPFGDGERHVAVCHAR